MCGLCGGTGAQGEALEFVQLGTAMMEHRGPDSRSITIESGVTLGHDRLAIIDLSDDGRQPFVSDSGRFCIVYNGEIYNHQQLRRRYSLNRASACDGAILPELWQRLGVDCLRVLRGMYAVCCLDRADGSVTLATDPLGMKPLYWCRTASGSLRFSSELAPLVAGFPSVAVDRAALSAYLERGRLPLGSSGLTQIARIRPGEWIRFPRDGGHEKGAIDVSGLARPYGSWAEAVEELVESVRLHLTADVPMGLMLSSGVDSAVIAWAAKQLGMQLETFTVAMKGTPSEAPGARLIADAFGHNHQTVDGTPSTADVQHFLASLDRPTMDGLNTYLVCEAAASANIKVVLAGTGGDELLLGYPHHRRAQRAMPNRLFNGRRTRAVAGIISRMNPPKGRGRLRQYAEYGLPGSYEESVRMAHSAIVPSVRKLLLDVDPMIEAADAPLRTLFDRSMESRVTLAEWDSYLKPMLLADADTFSMANSVEERTPFVDIEFVAAIAAIPSRGLGKSRFVEATGDPTLVQALKRPKLGFGLPMDLWMRHGPLAAAVNQTFTEKREIGRILDSTGTRVVHDAWLSGVSGWPSAWSLVALESWLEKISKLTRWT